MTNPTRYKLGRLTFFLFWISCQCLGISKAALLRDNYPEEKKYEVNLRSLQTDTESDQFIVEWEIDLGDKDDLIQSSLYLKAGLEQAIKDYINNDIECDPDIDASDTAFHSVALTDVDPSTGRKLLRITGSGKCNGNKEKCRYKMKKVIPDADEIFIIGGDDDKNDDEDGDEEDKKSRFLQRPVDDEFCQELRTKKIFGFFQDVFVTGLFFSYNADVTTAEKELEQQIDLEYNVTFQPGDSGGLNEISEFAMDVGSIVNTTTKQCTEPNFCVKQRWIIMDILRYFGMKADDNKHECRHDGINCDGDDIIEYLWIGKSLEQTIVYFYFIVDMT